MCLKRNADYFYDQIDFVSDHNFLVLGYRKNLYRKGDSFVNKTFKFCQRKNSFDLYGVKNTQCVKICDIESIRCCQYFYYLCVHTNTHTCIHIVKYMRQMIYNCRLRTFTMDDHILTTQITYNKREISVPEVKARDEGVRFESDRDPSNKSCKSVQVC